MNALILVDIQNDFLPGGALGVAEGDQVIPVANRLALGHPLVIATQDWHPPDHSSFSIWPVHCVQNTKGAQFAADLDTSVIQYVFQKGTDPEIDSYSGFFDNDSRRKSSMSVNRSPISGNRPRRAAMWMLATSRIVTPSAGAWRPSSWVWRRT